MLIAHVEQEGVWAVAGGMQRLAVAMQQLASSKGVVFRFGEGAAEITVEHGAVAGVVLESGERLHAGSIVMNGDAAALSAELLGAAVASAGPAVAPRNRSLSALTWAFKAKSLGFPLVRHNVFFSADYAVEFDDLFRRSRLPDAPTVYVCAQDRGGQALPDSPSAERLLMLVNAPATGDAHEFSAEEIARCETRALKLLERCGLSLAQRSTESAITSPSDFHRMFPGTGGALYGAVTHGAMASFRRPASATRVPGLYLAGGSTHPGAGVPMAALSGRLAARRLLADRASIRPFRQGAIFGGTSTG